MENRLSVRIYLEDTDAMGVVYHASYLRFCERGRTECVAALGTPMAEWIRQGVMFPIYSLKVTFKAPARLGDELVVVTRPRQTSPFRVTFEQRVERPRDGRLIVEAVAETTCTDREGNLREYPELGLPQA